jgi:hypothetical protein
VFAEEFLRFSKMSNFNDEDNYTAGRRDEQARQQDNANTQGLLIGLLIVLGIGGIAAALFFFNRNETTVVPVVAPTTATASPSTVEKSTIIREKSTEVVPVPVPASPAQPNNINITVPSSQPSASAMPSASAAPSTEPSAAAPAPSTGSSPATSATTAPANPSP